MDYGWPKDTLGFRLSFAMLHGIVMFGSWLIIALTKHFSKSQWENILKKIKSYGMWTGTNAIYATIY